MTSSLDAGRKGRALNAGARVGTGAVGRIPISIELLGLSRMINSPSDTHLEHWKDLLRERFPIARSAGFSCFEGWKPILVRLLERLSTIVKELPSDERRTFTVVELRQKFGTLTVYLSEAPTPAMWAAIGEASEASMVTCEVCGSAGVLAERNGWISVRCDRHENWSRFDRIAG